jgi:hypothetical protein
MKIINLQTELYHGEENCILFLIVKTRGKSVDSFIHKTSRLSKKTPKCFVKINLFSPLSTAIAQAMNIGELIKGYGGEPAKLLLSMS